MHLLESFSPYELLESGQYLHIFIFVQREVFNEAFIWRMKIGPAQNLWTFNDCNVCIYHLKEHNSTVIGFVALGHSFYSSCTWREFLMMINGTNGVLNYRKLMNNLTKSRESN